ncbi:MAG: hypothetical protein IPO35_13890 [Uliginosibacterium sp.]|jgi:hypothetical protein|nr:hypothetical protein [Uliginosibacterium sp.]
MPHSGRHPGKRRDGRLNTMPERDNEPVKELLKYALIAGGMSLVVLVLTRGKWLTGLLIGIWLVFVVLRVKRVSAQRRKD